MGKIYEHIDSAIMKSVNEGVRAWNWTTGKTKADLANMCSVGGSAMFSLASWEAHDPFTCSFIPFFILDAIIKTKMNNDTEHRELNALEKGLKDPVVERRYRTHELHGSVMLGTGSAMIVAPAEKLKEFFLEYGIGSFLIALENYTMRAENFPRRKNVFSRALDSLRDSLAEYGLNRQPARVKNYYRGGTE
jgi:hypothetical protein